MSAAQRTTSLILLVVLSSILGCAERQARIENLERQNVQLADDKQLLSTELATVNVSVEQMRREMAGVNQTADKQHEKNAVLTAQLDKTVRELKAGTVAAAAANVQIAELSAQLKTANSESDAARAAMTKAVAAVNAEREGSAAAMKAAEAREQELTRQVAELTEQLEAANKKTESPARP